MAFLVYDFAGEDKNRKSGSVGEPECGQAYSSYAELNFPFTVKGIDLNVALEFVPYRSDLLVGCRPVRRNECGFEKNGSDPVVCRPATICKTMWTLKGTKAIRLSDSFSFPVFVQVIWNPRVENVHLAFGFTLR